MTYEVAVQVAASHGEDAYPDGYAHIPKDRIGYMHCKDVVRNGDKYEWMKMGAVLITSDNIARSRKTVIAEW